ncbi:MAG TPA: hypothetical protein VG839_01940 [Asticcacaulis sp.]|nr:hypothetical protein [Asticcacaulis sp.]
MAENAEKPKVSDDFLKILSETETRVRHSAHAHWAATNRFDTLNDLATATTLIGGFLVSLLAAIPVMYQALYTLHALAVNSGLFVLGGLVSAVSILQAVQRWGERTQSHNNAANAYSSLRRKLEILRLNLPDSAGDLTGILEELVRLGETTPAVPATIWRRAIRALR